MSNKMRFLLLVVFFAYAPVTIAQQSQVIMVTSEYYEIEGHHFTEVRDALTQVEHNEDVSLVVDYLAKTQKVLQLLEGLRELKIEKISISSADLFPEQNRLHIQE